MDTRFIRVLQKDIVSKPEEWKNAKPGKFIKLPNRAKFVYCVLSVIAFSSAGNARGQWVKKGHRLSKDWFWTSHRLLQQLTGLTQKTVQRGISELKEAGFIGYHPSKAQGQKCFFRITRVKYKESFDELKSSESSGAKKRFSKNDDGRIWTLYKARRFDLLTSAEELRLDEMKRKIEKETDGPKIMQTKKPIHEKPKLPDDD